MYQLAEMFQASASIQEYMRRYFDRLGDVLRTIDRDTFAKMADTVEEAAQRGNCLYIIANGGSAGAAAHLVNDLVAGSYQEGAKNFRAFSLADNSETVTALGNDAGYDNIFARQIAVYARPGDVILAMSVSGNSENILRGVAAAKACGATTLGWCGFDGGKLATACDLAVTARSTKDEYGPVEDSFAVMGHILMGYLAMRRGKMLHH